MGEVPSWAGCWTRQRFSVPGKVDDVTTEVTWLQSGSLFVDIRVPAERPDFAGCLSLADCTPVQRAWLARQAGFAGHLETYGDVYRWHRHFEFGQPAGLPDAGRMACQGDWWLEEGLHVPYLEHWTHHPWRGGPCLGRKFMLAPATRDDGWREGIVVVVDETFMLGLDRRRPGGDASGTHSAPGIALDVEISRGTVDPRSGIARIEQSTLPFREGLEFIIESEPASPRWLSFICCHPTIRGRELHWQTAPPA